jgi:hypothetical protein
MSSLITVPWSKSPIWRMVQFKQNSTPKDGYYEILMGNECKTLHFFLWVLKSGVVCFCDWNCVSWFFLRDIFALNYYFYVFRLFW